MKGEPEDITFHAHCAFSPDASRAASHGIVARTPNRRWRPMALGLLLPVAYVDPLQFSQNAGKGWSSSRLPPRGGHPPTRSRRRPTDAPAAHTHLRSGRWTLPRYGGTVPSSSGLQLAVIGTCSAAKSGRDNGRERDVLDAGLAAAVGGRNRHARRQRQRRTGTGEAIRRDGRRRVKPVNRSPRPSRFSSGGPDFHDVLLVRGRRRRSRRRPRDHTTRVRMGRDRRCQTATSSPTLMW